ncbi:hypothetical protein Bca52824_070842 [Brassica carinata]|uniref:Phytosulfokine n=1 Tax=Brassica carinata TaxID=52824 RepID=A0A8X7Q8Z4_BRACI|nr:hypothetical protein Bca52824_070842 [Brassica carinata]
MVALVLCCTTTLTCTARPEPADFPSFTISSADILSLSCEKDDDEDCLTRRTLTAHLDYIYRHE